MSLPFRLLSIQLQQQLRQAGIYLEALEQTEQIQDHFGDNNSERAQALSFEEREEEENNMVTKNETTEKTETSPPPAGGTENARALADLLKKVGDAADRAAPRKVSERVVEAAIPTGIVVAGALVMYGGYVLIENKWGRLGMMKQAAAIDAMGKQPQLNS